MNKPEREIIILNSAWTMIEDMVNWTMFVTNDAVGPTNLTFNTSQHSRLFIILLGDFLSENRAFKGETPPFGLRPAPSNAAPSDQTFLFHLRQVCSAPSLGKDVGILTQSIESFANWLDGEFTAENVNLHAIDVVADITVTRYRYLKMCGDIAKHSLARLATNARHLRTLLNEAGHPVSEQQSYLAIENFFEWFHTDIFNYHSSQIAEFLNNIRWSIYNYLQPEFRRSYHLMDKAKREFPAYSYHMPDKITEPTAIAMYWDAMNRSRSRPYVPQFIVTDALKQRY